MTATTLFSCSITVFLYSIKAGFSLPCSAGHAHLVCFQSRHRAECMASPSTPAPQGAEQTLKLFRSKQNAVWGPASWDTTPKMGSDLQMNYLEECKVYDVFLNQNFVHEGQPLAVNCSVHRTPKLENIDYNVTWFKSGSQTSVAKDKHSRIHQQNNLIWFLPATLEDSGSYECVIRNLTSCRKIYMKLTVFKNIYGLCFNEKFTIGEEILTSSNAKVVCPHLEYFRDEENTLPIQWYKDCKLLEEERFVSFSDYLVIKNATLHDKGNYTCRTSYSYNGKQYNISRDISLTVTVSPSNTPPEIFYPRNNSIEVELGSRVIVDCNVTGTETFQVYWTVNNTYIDKYFKDRVFEEEDYEGTTSYEGHPLATVRLNISEVNSEDYERHFVCHAFNSFGQAAAYIVLQHRVTDFQRSLTGGLIALLLLTCITLLIFKLFKIDIVLWYRSSCCPFGKKKDGKIFDAYVMYPIASGVRGIYALDNFVLRILPEILERQCGYNLFILGRDDLPGEAVANVIDETIKQSRRVIIILESEVASYNVIEDTFEQQLVLYNALIRDEVKVILIELDKIQNYTNLPESIRYIRQKHGAIRWKGDFTEPSVSANTKFWKKVQ
nr:interleukin-1 receptor type 1-like [Pelodiscus sinensis]|eukprot:XP_014434119.1 interleukin-1 receptor type 1-like [Pelodiscus sinensis]